MIGRLRGIVIDKTPPSLLLEVQGVGYEIEAPMSTFYKLPLDNEQEVIIHTHLVIRDDAHLLFGFASIAERRLFRTLIKINGVGAKMALAILSGMEADEFASCIVNEDTMALTRLPGIGKKTAERLIIEMRDKLPKEMDESEPSGSLVNSSAGVLVVKASSQAQAALVSLGYKPAEANKMVASVKDDSLSTEDIIRQALQNSMKKN